MIFEDWPQMLSVKLTFFWFFLSVIRDLIRKIHLLYGSLIIVQIIEKLSWFRLGQDWFKLRREPIVIKSPVLLVRE